MLQLPQLKHLESADPRLYDALNRIVTAVNNLGRGTGVDPAGTTAPPAPVAALSVAAAGGIFDVAITDNSPLVRGISYFVESDSTPAFTQPHVYSLGPSRNARFSLGNLTLYWRAYSQYLGSAPSAPIAFGNPPQSVAGGGATPGPAQQPSAGSGTASSNGQQGGSGFGKELFRPAPSAAPPGPLSIA
ncbi:MAG: hypothetical protein WAM91_14460 [Candidatus Acidiferrales bacterium]